MKTNSGCSTPVVYALRVRENRVQFPAARISFQTGVRSVHYKLRAYGLVAEHGIRIAGTAVRFRLGPKIKMNPHTKRIVCGELNKIIKYNG